MDLPAIDRRGLLARVIRAAESIRGARTGESNGRWRRAVAEPLQEAENLLGTYGENNVLTEVVTLCTQLLDWHHLDGVGVEPTSDPPWKVLLGDLLELPLWGDGVRRTRALSMLRQLAQRLAHLTDDVEGDVISVPEFSKQRGLQADTVRVRLRRHNELAGDDDRDTLDLIRPRGLNEEQRLLYDHADLVNLLAVDRPTEE